MIDGAVADEHERAANAYLVWPLAVLALVRERPGASAWARLHTRQALAFGIAAALAYVAILALPLLAVITVPWIGTTAVVWLYALGIVADFAAAIVWLVLCVRYRERALRGELFAIPVVTRLTDRFFRLEHD